MKIAIHGLGRMGMQIAERLTLEGHHVIAHNRSPEPIQTAAGFGAIAAMTKHDVVAAFAGEQPVIWIMLPADIVQEQLREWLEILPHGSIIIDGGNAVVRKTKR